MQGVKNFFPIIRALREYSKSKLGFDLVAGITVASVLIPQGLAYAVLAGVPPIYGLYTGFVPLIIYAFLGTTPHLSIGPVAVSSLLVLSGVSAIAEPGSAHFIALVICSGFLIGVCQAAIGFVRLGFLVNFISLPVMSGFSSAAAVIILSTQLRDAFGISVPRFESVFDRLGYVFVHLGETSYLSLIFCAVAILLIWIFKKIHKNIPGPLIVIVIGALLVFFFDLERNGLQIVGEVPEGLPRFSLPFLSWEDIRALFPVVITVTIIGIVESISIAKVLESKHQTYDVNVDKELIAIGFSKIVGSFFQSIPSSGSFTRSAINSNLKAQTTLASIITAFVIGLTLLFLTPLFFFLPSAVLAAIILIAVIGLVDIKEAVHLYKTHKRDFTMMLVTFVLTLALGIQEGVLIGVVLSIASVLIKSSKPHMAVMGHIPGTGDYRNISRFPEAQEVENAIVIRFDDQLYFANASYFKDKVKKFIGSEKYRELEHVILDASNMHDVDSTGLKVLKEVDALLKKKDIALHLCGVKGPVRDYLFKNEMLMDINRHHMNIRSAVAEIKGEKTSEDKKKRSMQTNLKN